MHLRANHSSAEGRVVRPSAAVAVGMKVSSTYPNIPDQAKGTWTGLVEFSLPITCMQVFLVFPKWFLRVVSFGVSAPY